MMTTTADLTAYGPIIEASERLLDSLPVDGMILKHDQEIVAVNAKAAEKGLVQGMKCYEGWPTVKKMCQWCRAKKALKSGKVIDYMVRAMPNEEGEMVIVNEGGFIMDAHWYPIAPDLYVHFAGVCHVAPEQRAKIFEEIEIFLRKLAPEDPSVASESIKSIEDAAAEQVRSIGG
jgi:hypothetical protein